MHQRSRRRSEPSRSQRRFGGLQLPFAVDRQPVAADLAATWRQARPSRIAAGLEFARRQSAGGWCVAGRSGELGTRRSLVRTVAGLEIALWRDVDGAARARPGACPHMGALLTDCPVLEGTLVCRWHGMRLGDRDPGAMPVSAMDDGELLWLRVPGLDDAQSDAPVPHSRPPADRSISSVVTLRGECSPDDVVANRLDPWHGAWFHPYAFSDLQVDDEASTASSLVVDVTFRLNRSLGVPVRAVFRCPDSRTVVMEIVEGEGAGSVVETHATPITAPGSERPITVVTELVVAHSTRRGFVAARALSPVVAALMRHTARRLWVDDLAYAERRSLLRRRGESYD